MDGPLKPLSRVIDNFTCGSANVSKPIIFVPLSLTASDQSDPNQPESQTCTLKHRHSNYFNSARRVKKWFRGLKSRSTKKSCDEGNGTLNYQCVSGCCSNEVQAPKPRQWPVQFGCSVDPALGVKGLTRQQTQELQCQCEPNPGSSTPKAAFVAKENSEQARQGHLPFGYSIHLSRAPRACHYSWQHSQLSLKHIR